MEKETGKKAKKKTDHIDEELRLEIFKTEVFPAIFSLVMLEF